MSLRPRYTWRAKAGDLRTLGNLAARAAVEVTHAVAPPVRVIAMTVLSTARAIITARYTDPKETIR